MNPPALNDRQTPLHVLVVDDIPDNLELLEEVLAGQGYQTSSALSGREALEELQKHPVDLIIADAMMPGMDGFQLCKEVKRNLNHADIPFIIYTGNYLDTEDEVFARSIGVDRYVMKYDGVSVLCDAVRDILRQRYGVAEQCVGNGSPVPLPTVNDDQTFLELHHAVIVRKLEDQMEQLKESELRYRNLFEYASIGMFVLDRNTRRILDVNKKGIQLLGYSKRALSALPSLPFVEGTGFPKEESAAHGEFSTEAEMLRSDGTTLDVEVAAGPLLAENDERELLYVLDITEQKKLAQQLVQADKMALMGRLAAGIAHDIRNPLAAISLNLQFLLKRFAADSAERGPLEFAVEGAQRIEKIIDHTLGLARLGPPVVRPEQLNDIVHQALQFLKSPLEEKRIAVDLQLSEDLPLVCVEAKQIEQVLLNLMQNAIDASPENGVITLSSCGMDGFFGGKGRRGEQAALIIIDRGPGIPSDHMKHIFEPFQTTKQGGTGLGLAISKQIMDKHNSVIRVEPALGGGTIVRLIFPAFTPDSGARDAQS